MTRLAAFRGYRRSSQQHSLSLAIDEAAHQRLLSSAPSSCDRALAHSSALPHAGDWLKGVASAAWGLHLHDQEFRCCLQYWLGVPHHSTSYSCPECRSTADPYGDHQVGCGGNGDRIARHNAIRDILFHAARSAALAPTREAPSVVPDSHSRPADILLPTWSCGRPAALDVHVILPLQQLTLHKAASTPGHALQVGVQRKLASHLSACCSAGVDFNPLVAETGRIGRRLQCHHPLYWKSHRPESHPPGHFYPHQAPISQSHGCLVARECMPLAASSPHSSPLRGRYNVK